MLESPPPRTITSGSSMLRSSNFTESGLQQNLEFNVELPFVAVEEDPEECTAWESRR